VVYKLALPEGHGGVDAATKTFDAEDYEILPTHHDDDDIPMSASSTLNTIPESTSPNPDSDLENSPNAPRAQLYSNSRGPGTNPSRPGVPSRKTSRSPLIGHASPAEDDDVTVTVDVPGPYRRYSLDEPPVLPTALHSNFITSCIGFATMVMLCIPIPILHMTNVEPFRWPGSQGGDASTIWYALAVVAICGAVYVSPSLAPIRQSLMIRTQG
jgi:hypothetical protein